VRVLAGRIRKCIAAVEPIPVTEAPERIEAAE
jgi:hypothetical protein